MALRLLVCFRFALHRHTAPSGAGWFSAYKPENCCTCSHSKARILQALHQALKSNWNKWVLHFDWPSVGVNRTHFGHQVDPTSQKAATSADQVFVSRPHHHLAQQLDSLRAILSFKLCGWSKIPGIALPIKFVCQKRVWKSVEESSKHYACRLEGQKIPRASH